MIILDTVTMTCLGYWQGKQLREVWRSCAGDNVEASESFLFFLLNPAADW